MGRVVLGFLIILSACSFNLVGPGQASLEFNARAVQDGRYLEQPEVQAEGGEGRITVHAKLSAPDPCQRLTADLRQEDNDLALWVTIQRNAEVCIGVIGSFEYDAAIHDLPPGAYRLRVVHTYPGTGWETVTALNQPVQVK